MYLETFVFPISIDQNAIFAEQNAICNRQQNAISTEQNGDQIKDWGLKLSNN